MRDSTTRRRGARLLAVFVVLMAMAAALVGGGLLARPATAAQGGLRLLVTAVMDDVHYSDLGSTIVRRGDGLDGGLTVLTTKGLQASATLDCPDEAECRERGLDGAPVAINQRLGLAITGSGFGGVVLRGRTAGVIEVTTVEGQNRALEFYGSVSGSAACAEGSCDVEMAIRAQTARGSSVVLNLTGTFDRGAGEWTALSGRGFVTSIEMPKFQ